eukprot:CAMPEP_0197287648 /NCGR_PEP_ID=MMETSP0890-20130614/4249_1 /TAXON_ID=44058 ORGANISM="Aureoumbra lagunensis, Strain CCMP1510" /NCGR_SAMPLE_ID=MMETSP0890 /ASSEMBLY_ACC=CAM_ASM_000533 /LENGTH=771 /DNA_ID=CAMNT_0042757591 /DNA_START=91 /DNA_END=2406 /DNA_ORIENTATION=-
MPTSRIVKRNILYSNEGRLNLDELETMITALQAENAALKQSLALYQASSPRGSLEIQEITKMSAFAFESYNAPDGARWERGADGCDVAFSSAGFIRQCYDGALRVKLHAAQNLPEQRELAEVALTGSGSDPYVLFTVVDEAKSKKNALNATDVARSSTIWRRGKQDQVKWENEEFTLFVRDPRQAQLAITVMDEDVASDDDLIGIGSVRLNDVAATIREKNVKLGLLSPRDSEIKIDARFGIAGAVAAGALGAATGGVALAALAAGMVAGAQQSEKQATVDFDLEYFKFTSDQDVLKLAPSLQLIEKHQIPQGASPGVDWRSLCDDEQYNYEPLCFVDQKITGTQAGIWRDAQRKKILVAFRGTSEPKDIITDASALITPFARAASRSLGDDHDDSVPAALGDPHVHAGFRTALDSVARRLKQLIMIAVDDNPGDWELELTGHSLGGALATIFALDVAAGIDASRALPVRPQIGRSWFDPRRIFLAKNENIDFSETILPRFQDTSLLTFGSPRTGDGAFASALDSCLSRSYRVVNGQDVVARLPRGFSYNHAGFTVLVDEDPEQPQLWVEGVDSGECPLKLTDAARRDSNLATSPPAEGSTLSSLVDNVLDNGKNISFQMNTTLFNPFDAAERLRNVALDKLSSPMEIAEFIGIDRNYADIELKLFSALTSGDAIRHHLEPAYFAAIMRATGGGKEKKLKLAEATESPPDTTSSASLKKVSENTVPKKVTAARTASLRSQELQSASSTCSPSTTTNSTEENEAPYDATYYW